MISGILLASGLSSRMGEPKLALPLRGRPILQHALDAAAGSNLDELIIVLPEPDNGLFASLALPENPSTRVARNSDPAGGQSGSLRCGLAAASPNAEAAAILLGDQPGLSSGVIDLTLKAFPYRRTPALRPLYSGARGEIIPGHPVVIERALWPEVERLPGDEGLRGLFLRRPDLLTTIPVSGEAPADIDTQDDYRRAENSPMTRK